MEANDQVGKLVDLSAFKKQKYSDDRSDLDFDQLWQFPDYYEYCIIPHYENQFSGTSLYAVDMGGCFANLIKEEDKYYLVSIIFSEDMSIPDIVEWLDFYRLEMFPPTDDIIKIEGAAGVSDAVAFNGYPIALIERGDGIAELDPSKLEEVTKEFEQHKRITNTGLGEQVDIEDHLFD